MEEFDEERYLTFKAEFLKQLRGMKPPRDASQELHEAFGNAIEDMYHEC